MKSLLEFSVHSRWTFTAYISIVVAGGVNMTILEKLYDGEIIPSETAVPDTEEYREKLQKKTRLAEEIKNALSAEKSELADQLMALCLSIAEDECKCTYAEGVRFGIDLMIEINRMNEASPSILPQLEK